LKQEDQVVGEEEKARVRGKAQYEVKWNGNVLY